MGFTVENGTGVAGANSYVDVPYATAYFADRGNATWAGAALAAQQVALVQATDYVEGRFNARMLGEPVNDIDSLTPQGLHFPANNAGKWPNNVVPDPLKRAVCEYAVRSLVSPLAPDPTMDASGVAVVNTHKKLGPLEQTFEVLGSKYPKAFRPYPAADMLLTKVLRPGGGRVMR